MLLLAGPLSLKEVSDLILSLVVCQFLKKSLGLGHLDFAYVLLIQLLVL